MRHIVMAVVLGWASVCFAAGAGPAQKWEYAVYAERGTHASWADGSQRWEFDSSDFRITRTQFCARIGQPVPQGQQGATLSDVMNAAGASGWELVTVSSVEPALLWFKRPAP